VLAGPGRVEGTAVTTLAMRGPGVRPQVPGPVSGRGVDVMPTVLHALGVPISRELAGRVLTDLFRDDFLERYAVREVATYGSPSAVTAPREGRPLDQEMIDRLRSLGYVK
jgi:arylsulfatase A-like enzyme